MKWKREEPGKYSSGKWLVAGSGTKWTLYYAGEHIDAASSKKELQILAEETEKADPPKKPKRPPGKNMPAVQTAQPSSAEKGPVSLDSALRSIRLTLDSMADSNNALAADMRKLADSNESMAKAVRELLTFLTKMMEKKK